MTGGNTTLLIDADTLIYAATSANQHPFQWNEWLWSLHANWDEVVGHFEDTVLEIKEGLQCDNVIMALSDDKRWRNAVMPSYKSNRASTMKPICYKALREYVHEAYTTFQRPGLEGDDVLGILSTHPDFIDGKKIVVSIDKDMKTLPGLLCNYAKDRRPAPEKWNVNQVSVREADFAHMFQTLTGDTTDGYKGCPGVGPVKAEGILKGIAPGQWWKAVVECYKKAGLGADVALQNAQVARICRAEDYDFEKKEVIPWQP